MKKLYLIARNHMDPSWLRCFEESYEHLFTGDTVRPYSDIEELQIRCTSSKQNARDLSGGNQSGMVSNLFSSHPDTATRIERISQRCITDGYERPAK